VKILVIDDHPSVAEGIRTVLCRAVRDSTVDVASTAPEAVSKCSSQEYAVLVLDMSLPGRSGPELVAELKRVQSTASILVYSVHSEQQFGVRAIRAGADGYLTKDRPIEELLEAVRVLLSGKKYITNELALALAEAVSGPVEPISLLSDRELQVLRMVVHGASTSDMAYRLHLSVKTVSTYRSRILEKLRVSSTADLIRYALQHGVE
jgi:two-component system, NarL family, invasion response regulator UvrY